jgi:Ca-activated chloride channel homolog
MTFDWPIMLLSLLSIPLIVAIYIYQQRRRQKIAARFSSLGLLKGAQGDEPGLRRHVPQALFLAGLTLLMLALARPQAVISMPRVEGTVILGFDVSGSMAAEDLEPTRMEAAKAAAREFVSRQPNSVKVGVVAFSDSGFNVQAPTSDVESILVAIDRLVPERGTSLGEGILVSLNTIARDLGIEMLEGAEDDNSPPPGTYPSAAIVLLSDGENNVSPDPLWAARQASDRGVRIYTIGVGSPGGVTLNIEGFAVHTRLDEPMLQQIAQVSGGSYYRAQDNEDLRAIYEDLELQLVIKPEKMEVTSIFTGVSLLALLVGGLFSLIWFSRMP